MKKPLRFSEGFMSCQMWNNQVEKSETIPLKMTLETPRVKCTLLFIKLSSYKTRSRNDCLMILVNQKNNPLLENSSKVRLPPEVI